MFKRFAALLIVFFFCSLTALLFSWQDIPGLELYSNTPVTKVDRISQDLGGKWNSYASLREAWTSENSASLIQKEVIVLPSNQEFKVAVYSFKVSGKWGFKHAQLALEGVYGKARVFLNGIEEINFLGEFEGRGGVYNLEISPTRLDFSRANTLYIELSPGSMQKSRLFGWLWPEQGKITGQIRLEAIPETTIDLGKTTVTFKTAEKQLLINLSLKHHQSLEHGPWAINAVIKENGQKAAECLLPLNAEGEYEQDVALLFNLPLPKYWSMEDPFLYELDLTLTNNRGDYDRIQMPIGISQVSQSDGKWTVRGQALDVKAEILTRDQEYLIRNQRSVEDTITKLKTQGVNAVYFMGFFPNESWLYAADRLGMGVWLELPVDLVPKGNIPSASSFEELLLISERHPSVMAWTAGKGLEPSQEANEFLQQIRARIPQFPVYQLLLPGQAASPGSGEISLEKDILKGEWGQAQYSQAPVEKEVLYVQSKGWTNEPTGAVSWFIFLLVITIVNLRSPDWSYQELFNPKPKRAVRRAFFWGCIRMVSRMFTVGAILTSLLFRLPLNSLPWLAYDQSFLLSLRNQNPWLIWIFISTLLIMFRLLRVGLAAPSFPHNPGALALACWLERRYVGLILVGMAWVATGYALAWIVWPAVYLLLLLVFLPLRIRSVWKAGGKYGHLWFLPLSILVVAGGILIAQYGDLFYLTKVILPLIDIPWSSLWDLNSFLRT